MISVSSLFITSMKGVSLVYLNETLGYFLKDMAYSRSINKEMKEIDQIGKQQLAFLINTNCEHLKHLGGHHLSDFI